MFRVGLPCFTVFLLWCGLGQAVKAFPTALAEESYYSLEQQIEALRQYVRSCDTTAETCGRCEYPLSDATEEPHWVYPQKVVLSICQHPDGRFSTHGFHLDCLRRLQTDTSLSCPCCYMPILRLYERTELVHPHVSQLHDFVPQVLSAQPVTSPPVSSVAPAGQTYSRYGTLEYSSVPAIMRPLCHEQLNLEESMVRIHLGGRESAPCFERHLPSLSLQQRLQFATEQTKYLCQLRGFAGGLLMVGVYDVVMLNPLFVTSGATRAFIAGGYFALNGIFALMASLAMLTHVWDPCVPPAAFVDERQSTRYEALSLP